MATKAKSTKKAPTKASSAEMLKYYRDMLLIRRFEEKAGQLYGMGKIAGFCHLYIGQEAVVTGMQACLKEGDQIITGYRDHGHMLACEMDPGGVMAELTGRIGGLSKGKGGSMHMFSKEKNFYGGHGIVGAQVPLGTGLAFANKYRGNDNVAVAYFGDGAANQGQVYEAFNMASLWDLPVVYVIENNMYAMGTSVARHASETELYKRGISFEIEGEEVDGMDVLAVREELEAEFHVAVHDGVVQFHRADEAAAAHAAAAVGLDADASVPLGERALHAGVPRIALDHRRCARCGWVRPERDDATWGKISFSRMMNPFGDGGYRS